MREVPDGACTFSGCFTEPSAMDVSGVEAEPQELKRFSNAAVTSADITGYWALHNVETPLNRYLPLLAPS